MVKRFVSITIAFVMILGTVSMSFAATFEERLADHQFSYDEQAERLQNMRSTEREDQIKLLQDLKIMVGTGNGLELDKSLTRSEGAVIYSRLLGSAYDQMIFGMDYPDYDAGLNDLPGWAADAITYLHFKGLVKGVEEGRFGYSEPMTAEQFTTMILRGLGYDDSKGEFVWNQSLQKAVEVGILSEADLAEIEKDDTFTREDMAIVAYNALFTNFKDQSELLMNRGVFAYMEGGFTQLFYVTLNDEELEEFKKASGDEYYSIFPDSPEKKQAVLDKARDYFNEVSEYYRIYVNDEAIEFEVTSVNDAGNIPWYAGRDDNSRVFRVTLAMNHSLIGETEADHYFIWDLYGNKLRVNSDKNLYGTYLHGFTLKLLNDRVDNFKYLEDRYRRSKDEEGAERYMEANGYENHYIDVDRRFHIYDGKKILDAIRLERRGSLDQFLYVEIYE
jgi:hypothetical protein